MWYYMELQSDKTDEGRIMVEMQDGRVYGLHTSYPDGFARLDTHAHLPQGYLKKWCRASDEQEARNVMPELFDFLAKYEITEESQGTWKETDWSSEVV